jgi:hypothetical protein
LLSYELLELWSLCPPHMYKKGNSVEQTRSIRVTCLAFNPIAVYRNIKT